MKEGTLEPHGGKPQRRPCQGPLRGLATLPCSETGVPSEKCLKAVWWHYILHRVYLAFQNSTFAVRNKDRKPGEVGGTREEAVGGAPGLEPPPPSPRQSRPREEF